MLMKQGKYRARIEDYGVFQSTAGQQHLTVFVRFTPTGYYDPSTGEITACDPETREYTKAITEKTFGWVRSDLKAIGYDRDSLRDFDPEAPGAADLFGGEIDVVCDHEEYNGHVRERWSIYHERRRKRVDPGRLADLDARFGDQPKRHLGSKQPPTPPAPSDDDPF
jgi:hypothetical protein